MVDNTVPVRMETGPSIGCVRYLNSKPLIHGHGAEVSFEVPASLADGLHAGRLDVALSPIYELMAHPGYLVVDDVAIASRGEVFSVFIAHQGDIADLHTLFLDTASRTSAHLQRVLLAEFHGVGPREVPRPAGEHPAQLREGEGALLIGDPAIDFRIAWGERCRYFDLGAEWQRATGLPFVFAAWLVRPGTPEPEKLADRLRAWRAEGQRRIDEVVADERRYPLRLTRAYLTERIRYRLGEPEKRAIREFARLLNKHGLADASALAEPRWI